MRPFVFLLLLVLPCIALAQRSYPPTIKGAERVVYKKTEQAELAMWIFKPTDWKASDQRPAAVFFFGGGWNGGSPEQFQEAARRLATHGMVAAVADYRVKSRHQTLAKDCVEDCKSAVRYLRENADKLGIQPDRILAGGGSAGGHTAACTAVISGFEVGNKKVSSVPNALALYNPACVLAPWKNKAPLDAERMAGMEARMGTKPEELSPIHHVKAGAPPTIIFHGKNDTTVPYLTAELFTEAMKEAGNQCQLVGFEGEGHGFFNIKKNGDTKAFDACHQNLEKFLTSLGWLSEK